MKSIVSIVFLVLCLSLPAAAAEDDGHLLIKVMSDELDYSMQHLTMTDGTKPYFMAYAITDVKNLAIGAELGAVNYDNDSHNRILDVDVRVGSYELDNTHKIRGGGFGFDLSDLMGGMPTPVSLEDDPDAIRHALWLATDQKFKAAAKKYQRVQTNLKTKVEEEDKSADFSVEEAHTSFEPEMTYTIDREAWVDRIREVSQLARKHPLIYNSSVSLNVSAGNRYFVNSEGAKIQTGVKFFRVTLSAATKAEDGMDLSQSHIFNSCREEALPSKEDIKAAFQRVIDQVLALREAPVVEPYSGPAILVNRASGVFFHEIFGHRIEGHRQRDVDEGQTFTKKVGEAILPEFISVIDDPTRDRFGGEDLRGFYRYDDEGVPAQKVNLVEKGILKNFLMSRTPVKGFPSSNGHGRRAPGNKVVSRMGNTMVMSDKTVPFEKLRELLIEECKIQDKPYGLLFEDISGGFTGTQRAGAQVFKVLPILVYRIFPDGRPDELVRGVDIVGTPLMCFSKITYTGDDPAIFNGTCGAESGSVPVSAVSPSILVSQMEVEKRSRDQDKPPILPPPIAGKGEVRD